jgi:hypothetical protein
LTGAGPQDVVNGLVALELAFDKAGISSGSKHNALALNRYLSHPRTSMEADGQKADGNEGEGSAHQIALEWAFINLARLRFEILLNHYNSTE